MKQFLSICFVLLFINLAFSQTPCKDGIAGGYPCLGLDLQAHISAIDLGAEEHEGFWCNDIWGWTDPETGKEYALVGMTNGTSFVDITDAVNPTVLGVLREHNFQDQNGIDSENSTAFNVFHDDGAKSVWRDIKVYNNHAYIVSEDRDHGLQVFDLTRLRNVENPSATNFFTEDGHYDGIGQAHNLAINEETGYAYAVGFRQGDRTCAAGGLHMIDLKNPKTPTYAGCFDDDGYTHDTQCVIYNGPDQDYVGREICFNSNEDEIVFVDVTDKSNPILINKHSYDNFQYVHQGWLTEDHRFFLSNDELDETRLQRNTYTFIWDLSDLDANSLTPSIHIHGTRSIDHNLYIKENNVFESNYSSGLRILSIDNISNGLMQEIAFFDTYTPSDAAVSAGSWSNYPFFDSGNIIISDITNGLFIVKLPITAFISQQPQSRTYCVGDHVDIPILVTGEDLSYQWQLKEAGSDEFENITDMTRYHSTQTDSLHAHAVTLTQSGNQYRCIVSQKGTPDSIISEPMTLTVIDTTSVDFSYEIVQDFGAVSFTNQSNDASDSYVLNFGDGFSSTKVDTTYTYSFGGLYEAKLVGSNQCSSDTTIRFIDLIIVRDQPDNIATTEGENVTFSMEAEGDNLTYQWQLVNDEGNILNLSNTELYLNTDSSQLTLANVTVSQDNTQYRCVVTSSTGTLKFSNSASLEVIPPLGLIEESINYIFPTISSSFIEINLEVHEPLNIYVKSLDGKIVSIKQINASEKHINISSLPNGVYLLSTKDLVLGRFVAK